LILWDARDRVGEWVRQRIPEIGPSWGEWYQAIGLEEEGKLIAGVVYNLYSGADIAMHVAGEGRWLRRQFTQAAFGYPFLQLKTRRVTSYTGSRNETSIRLQMGLGFEYEGRMRHALPDDDVLIFGLLKEHCRYL
jgi:RimJ/RimL family protein N-acetyltransferase